MEEVAAHVGVRKDSIYRWIERRGLPAQKVGKLWKLKLSEVDAWVRAGGARGSAEEAEEKRSATPAEPPATAPQASFILIVDDDESMRDTLRDVVTDQGHGALTASDGIEALRLLRSDHQPKPGLILLDLGLPNLDGIGFLEEQKRDPRLAGIPVIIITAARRSAVDGAPVIRKPFDIGKLVDAIRRAIDG